MEIEILGRPAVAALKLLSEKTGVSLAVAPEDLKSVGERKLTIITKGVTLKAIMVNLPEALQECHWDADKHAKQPVYLLHRNGGADYVKFRDSIVAEAKKREAEKTRRDRRPRIEDAVRALKLSPQELQELERSDYFLALAAKDATSRAALEAFLALPAEGQAQFFNSGEYSIAGKDAPRAMRKAVEEAITSLMSTMVAYVKLHPEALTDELAGKAPEVEAKGQDIWEQGVAKFPEATLIFRDEGCEIGRGVVLQVRIPGLEGENFELVVAPPKFPDSASGSPLLMLLLASGVGAPAAAEGTLHEWQRRGIEAEARRRDEDKEIAAAGEAVGGREPAVLFSLAGQGPVVITEFQRTVAEKTGFAIISDYFTRDFVTPSAEARSERPLWQVLDLLGSSAPAGFRWRLAGRCLVFYRSLWPTWAMREIPESILLRYRAKLEAQHHLTLQDVISLYTDLSERLQTAELAFEVPEDLRQAAAGLSSWLSPYASWAPYLLTALSPEQMRQVRSAGGIRIADLPARAREKMMHLPVSPFFRGATAEEMAHAKCRLEEVKGEQRGRHYTQFDLRLSAQDERKELGRVTIKLWEMVPPGPQVD